MNHTADIRSVRPGDAPQLAHIQTESWKAAFREIIPADILSEYTDPEPVTRMYEHLLTHGIAHGYILERDGAPHGIAWWDAAREPDMAGTAELICIHSLPAHWHQGYGKLLLEKVLRDVKSAGYPSILLWVFDANLPAIRFYHRQRQKASLLRFRGGDVYQGPLTPTTAQKARRRSICGGPFPQIKNSPEALP